MENSECLICSSNDLVGLPGYETARLCRCLSCGMVFSRSVPTAKELEEHYNGYGRADYLSPLTVKRYHELLDEFEEYRCTGKLLDVGCGIGYFLEEAAKRGWEVHGTEYTDEAVDICARKGIEMQKGELDASLYEAGSFDVITSFEVLEHINTPRLELAKFWALLRSGGLVYLTTPNFNSLLRYRLGAQYNVICYPEHLSYYTPRTLTNVFERSGFTRLKLKTTGISLTRLRTSQKRSRQSYISSTSDDEKVRQVLESRTWLNGMKNLVNELLSLLGVGDTLKGWFVKTS